MRRIDDPDEVAGEYATEERLVLRGRILRDYLEGPQAEDVAFDAVVEAQPRRVLEVGCGTGEFGQRLSRAAGLEVVAAVDVSPRMVELARRRGVNATRGDVQRLAFADASFDCVVANWMLYHASDIDQAVAEIARVLDPQGRLVAATQTTRLLPELWSLLGDPAPPALSFTAENGEDFLARHFQRVERKMVEAHVVFPDWQTAQAFVAVTITRSHLAQRLPHFAGSLRATLVHAVFIAHTPRH